MKSSQTHNSTVNLIDREADRTLSARKISPNERKYAQSKGVSVIETPIAINGVQPTKESIANRSYSLTTEVYAIIRSDTDRASTPFKIHEWLQTSTEKQIIVKSNYMSN